MESINNALDQYQHLITAFGVVATLLGICLSYYKMSGKINEFKLKAIQNINSANLATLKANIKELQQNQINIDQLFLNRIMDLREMVNYLKGAISLKELNIDKEWVDYTTPLKLFENSISANIFKRPKDREFDEKKFRLFLSELKDLLLDIELKNNELLKGKKNDS